ncbi:MAG: divergent polysaccharide deacetylase family protein [Rhodospirillaceae bacterium]|nr:divergent polysaccharide deacetylase family protein [Rhodospirillaceae bacterium]
MRDDRLPEPGAIDPLRPVTSRRGSWIGGPGFIFFLLLVLIAAGGALYLQATGGLDEMLASGNLIDLGTTPTPTPAGESAEGPDLQPMGSFTADSPAAPAKQLVLTPLSATELLATRPAPRSLRLVPGEFDQPPVKRFARPALFLGTKPRIGIVVVGLGLNQGVTGAAIADLPPEITLSFSPYAPDLAAWIDAAHAYGHEVMVDLPLEPLNYPQDDPGPLGLLTALNKDENLRRLDLLLESAAGVTGVATQFGDRFLADRAALRPILSELGQRGLGFLDTSGHASALSAASKGLADAPLGVTTDMAIAQDESRQALATQIDAVMTLARSRKQALMVVQPYPLSIAALTSLAPAAKDRGLVLVPASAFLTKD